MNSIAWLTRWFNPRRLIMAMVGLLILVAATWYAVDMAMWHRVTAGASALTLQVPRSWSAEDLTASNLQDAVLARFHPRANKDVSVQVTGKNVTTVSSDATTIDQVTASLQQQFPELKILERIPLQNQDAIHTLLHYRYSIAGTTRQTEQELMVLWSGKKAYFLITQAPPDQFAANQPIFRRIFLSARVSQ